MADLAALDALTENMNAGVDVQIRHPTTNLPIGLTIKVAGMDSDKIKAIHRRNANEQLRTGRRLTAEEFEARTIKLQVALIMEWGWSDGLTLDGTIPACTPENAEAVLRRFPFIAEQIDAAAADRSRFLRV